MIRARTIRFPPGGIDVSIQVNLPLTDIAAEASSGFGGDEAEIQRYREEGTRRALALDNRGPARFDAGGRLAPDIVDAYRRHGFYVFNNVVDAAERAEIERDLAELLERAPVAPDVKIDKHGRPSLGADHEGRTFRLVRPLSDPLGGTDANYGRHQIKMGEPTVPAGAPEWVTQIISAPLQYSDACLRYSAHPTLLSIVASLNGEDFTPFNDVIWIKHPRLGGSVSWHQDGWTHWDSPDLDEGTHGFNTMMQLYGCDAANGLWVVPGSHRNGKLDIREMRDSSGSDRLPDALPLICEPGDLAITNRQAVHGSFANTSANVRVSLTVGFHRRRSVLNVTSGGVHNPVSLYDDAYIKRRSRVIMYGIAARQQRYPKETSFRYAPLASEADQYQWSPQAKADLSDYNMQDIGI
ncbi:MAG: hypothetical protein ACI9W2_002642 [Gammaproteobacteria bacterium]